MTKSVDYPNLHVHLELDLKVNWSTIVYKRVATEKLLVIFFVLCTFICIMYIFLMNMFPG